MQRFTSRVLVGIGKPHKGAEAASGPGVVVIIIVLIRQRACAQSGCCQY